MVAGKADDNDMATMLRHRCVYVKPRSPAHRCVRHHSPAHRCVYVHPDSPSEGRHWMTKTLSFHRLKLTNNVTDSRGHVSLFAYYTDLKPSIYIVEATRD